MPATSHSLCILLCSAPSLEVGRKIAGVLLERKLAACISIQPGIESHYVWEGKKEQQAECLLWIKTTANQWEAIQRTVQEIHPYACPELIKFSELEALPAYHQWVVESCKM